VSQVTLDLRLPINRDLISHLDKDSAARFLDPCMQRLVCVIQLFFNYALLLLLFFLVAFRIRHY